MLVGANKWWEATLLCGLDLNSPFTQGKGVDQKQKKRRNGLTYIYIYIYKTKVIMESDFDTPITLSKEEK